MLKKLGGREGRKLRKVTRASGHVCNLAVIVFAVDVTSGVLYAQMATSPLPTIGK